MRGLSRVAADRMEQPYNEWGAELYAEFPEERLKAVHWARYLIAVHLSFAAVCDADWLSNFDSDCFLASLHWQLVTLFCWGSDALWSAQRCFRFSKVCQNHHLGSDLRVSVLAHELALGASHVCRLFLVTT